MEIHKLPDWRIAKAAEVAAEVTLPNGNVVQPGSLVILVTRTESVREGRVMFATPGAPALALNIAIGASRSAAKLRGDVPWEINRETNERYVTGPGLQALFDHFEQAMVAATFSFQSMEAFANQIITNGVTSTYPYRRNGEIKNLSGDELERAASTEEKFSTILPALSKIQSPKGRSLWARFKKLKGVRDSATHLKSFDHYRRVAIDKDSLYHRLLNSDPKEFPAVAIQLMKYFSAPQGMAWLDEAERRLVASDV